MLEICHTITSLRLSLTLLTQQRVSLIFNKHEKNTKEAHPRETSGIRGRNLFQDDGTSLSKVKQRGRKGKPTHHNGLSSKGKKTK